MWKLSSTKEKIGGKQRKAREKFIILVLVFLFIFFFVYILKTLSSLSLI